MTQPIIPVYPEGIVLDNPVAQRVTLSRGAWVLFCKYWISVTVDLDPLSTGYDIYFVLKLHETFSRAGLFVQKDWARDKSWKYGYRALYLSDPATGLKFIINPAHMTIVTIHLPEPSYTVGRVKANRKTSKRLAIKMRTRREDRDEIRKLILITEALRRKRTPRVIMRNEYRRVSLMQRLAKPNART